MDYKDYKQNEKDLHFWHKARLFFLEKLLQSKFSKFNSERKILDIGCGTGTEIKILKKFGQVYALDKNQAALDIACTQKIKALLLDLEKENLPASSFNVISAFDILEHLKEDGKALKNIYTSLKPGGHLFLTVPAFQSLYGPHDIALEHKRRYNKKELLSKLKRAGFKVEIINYWNFLLFPLFSIYRIIKKYSFLFLKFENHPESKNPPAFINFLLYKTLKFDSLLSIKIKNLPYGLSIFAVAKK